MQNIKKGFQQTLKVLKTSFGDSTGNRTRVSGVRELLYQTLIAYNKKMPGGGPREAHKDAIETRAG